MTRRSEVIAHERLFFGSYKGGALSWLSKGVFFGGLLRVAEGTVARPGELDPVLGGPAWWASSVGILTA